MQVSAYKALLTLFVGFFFVSAACGSVVELPQTLPGESAELPQQAAPQAQPDALEPLAPLPDVDSIMAEPTVEFSEGDGNGPVEFVVGDVVWTLLQTAELGDSLASDTEEVNDLIANGRLVGVRFGLRNAGSEPVTFVGLTVVDEMGNRYDYLSAGLPFIVSEEACEVVSLDVDESVICTAIYDVDANASPLFGVLTDLGLLSGAQQQVDLGL